jgi:hypothetical protein
VRPSVHTITKGEGIVAFAVLLGFVVILQVLGGAYASGFGGYPDEPAHLVTALMVRDFIAVWTSATLGSSQNDITTTTQKWRSVCGRLCFMAHSALGS